MTNLVKIEKDLYSFYEGSQLIVKVLSEKPMPKKDLEAYRISPKMLRAELMGDFYKPRHFYKNIKPDIYAAIYYDGSELCQEIAKDFGWTEKNNGINLQEMPTQECMIVKDKDGNFTYYSIDEFALEFSEF